jgi:hypothetical protein
MWKEGVRVRAFSRLALASGWIVVTILLGGCHSPIMTDRSAANDAGSSAQHAESGIRHWI